MISKIVVARQANVMGYGFHPQPNSMLDELRTRAVPEARAKTHAAEVERLLNANVCKVYFPDSDKVVLVIEAEALVRRGLKTPWMESFTWASDVPLSLFNGSTCSFLASAWVDLQSSFSAMSRTAWSATLVYPGAGCFTSIDITFGGA